jgi:hypothetical protein
MGRPRRAGRTPALRAIAVHGRTNEYHDSRGASASIDGLIAEGSFGSIDFGVVGPKQVKIQS